MVSISNTGNINGTFVSFTTFKNKLLHVARGMAGFYCKEYILLHCIILGCFFGQLFFFITFAAL